MHSKAKKSRATTKKTNVRNAKRTNINACNKENGKTTNIKDAAKKNAKISNSCNNNKPKSNMTNAKTTTPKSNLQSLLLLAKTKEEVARNKSLIQNHMPQGVVH